ncbi:SKR-1 protein, partial [Aphelenchoides avenae]
MSSTAAPGSATPQQVICETSDQQQIAVELDVLRLSHTFDDLYKNLGLEEEGGEYPGTFPVKNIEARVFQKVVDWCKAHKDQPDPVVEKDLLTQQCKWFKFTDYDRAFFDVPVPELLELVMAANYLDIRRLYHYGCQAIADLIKGKDTVEARRILQQQGDLTRREIRSIHSQCPSLDPKADVVGEPGDVSTPIHIPADVLSTVFEKLTRADLERLQLVNVQFRNIILHNDRLPLRLLDEVHFTAKANYCSERNGILVFGAEEAGRLKGCAIRKLVLLATISSAHFALLLRVKSAWKNADVSVSLDRFASPKTRTRALTELLFCRELHVSGRAAYSPHSLMHLPVILGCNHLDMRRTRYCSPPMKPAEVVEWLEHEPMKKWDEPLQLNLGEWQLSGGLMGAVDALKNAFLSATSCKPYAFRIRTSHSVQLNELLSNALGEKLRIRFEEDRDD